jgi:hypothetical protein
VREEKTCRKDLILTKVNNSILLNASSSPAGKRAGTWSSSMVGQRPGADADKERSKDFTMAKMLNPKKAKREFHPSFS